MHNIDSVDFSQYKIVFCDSLQALEYLYKHGLHKSTVIKSSSPAVLLSEKQNIYNIESRWNVEQLGEFQSSIQKLSEDIFDYLLNVKGIQRELALNVSRSAVLFQGVLYKAACLEKNDFIEPRLFVKVHGNGGPGGNNMNSPWDKLLSSNQLFSSVNFSLCNDNWGELTTEGVSNWRRYKLAGIETLIYRLLVRLMKKLPGFMFKKEVLVPNENELIIETATQLMLHGVKVTEVDIKGTIENTSSNKEHVDIYNAISTIMQKRVEYWAVSDVVRPAMLLFRELVLKQLCQFDQLAKQWDSVLLRNDRTSKVVLMNAAGNVKGQIISSVCRKRSIPFIAVQHGVTAEISKLHGEASVITENSTTDAAIVYNSMNAKMKNKSHFAKAKTYVVGMSMRHNRMSFIKHAKTVHTPIVYISTNLYRNNLGLFLSAKTDYLSARYEQSIITKVLSKLPYKVCYKTYPEDNRRYADSDPVLCEIDSTNNIELFSSKLDMRYLVDKYRIFITSVATSTLSWPIMTGKPVVFISQKDKGPLTNDAYASMSKGIFVFNENDKNFHEKLRDFLSQPIEEIERLWIEKKSYREDMIRDYFSAYKNGAGSRASKIILRDYFN